MKATITTSLQRVRLAIVLSALATPTVYPAAPDYQRDIVPILRKYCAGCHNPNDTKGDLDVSTHQALLEGGGRGPALVAGKATESLLVATVEGRTKPFMPPKGKPAPTADDVRTLRAWIDAGAKPSLATTPTLVTPMVKPKKPPRLPATALAFATGDQFAVAGFRETLLVETKTGFIQSRLAGHAGMVNALAYAADGTLLVTVSGEPGLAGEANLWDPTNGRLIRSIRGHDDSLYACDLTHDKTLLATAGYDKDIVLWDAKTGAKVRTLKGHNDAVYGLRFRPDGKVLASASGDRTIKLWDVATGVRLDTFSQPTKEQQTVEFSPDGQRVFAAGADNRIRVWRISPKATEGSNPLLLARYAHSAPIIRLAISRDGKWLASSAEDRTLKLWDADQLNEKSLLEAQSDWATALAFAPDGQTLLTGRLDGTLAFYATKDGAKQRDIQPKAKPPAAPTLADLRPVGVTRGKANSLPFAGAHLAGAVAQFNPPMLTGAAQSSADGTSVSLEITPPATLAKGVYDLTFATAGGTTPAIKVHVDDLPQITEATAGKGMDASQTVALPAAIWGTIEKPGDTDTYTFNAKKGETLVFDLSATPLQSKLNAVLSLRDATGRVLAESNDFDGQNDPLLAFTAPADGAYNVRVLDLKFTGSKEHTYRLTLGALPFVTGVYPLGVSPNGVRSISLAGYNLPADGREVKVTAGASGQVAVPLDANRYRFRRGYQVHVGVLNEANEVEPNDTADKATPITAPGAVNGRIYITEATSIPRDSDLFRFSAKKGQPLIIETEAGQRGAPTDTQIELLDLAGKPVDRVWLQATRNSMVEFRGINSTQLELRCLNWQEMELNEYMYMAGEVAKLFRLPEGPDSGFLFYGVQGVRRNYFDTSAAAHALEDPCYTVQPFAPGTPLIPNGLPVFKLAYANDDASDRQIGRDSRLTFTPPTDGEYLIRVTDSRSLQGDRFAYRLVVRPPAPDFAVTVGGMNPVVNLGSGKDITFVATRRDGFEDAIQIEVSQLPPGVKISQPIVIEAGHLSARATLTADASAPALTPANANAAKISASAQIDGKKVTHDVGGLGTIAFAPKPKLLLRLEPAEARIEPGATVTFKLKIERNGFNGAVRFDPANLPHGIIVDNLGLNGITLLEGQTERELFLTARRWVPEQSRPFHLMAQAEGNQTSAPITVHVRRNAPLAGAK